MLRHEHSQPNENLVFYTFPLFAPYPHLTCLVSTRLGGVSTGTLHSLNLSFYTGDQEEAVITNRARVYAVAGVQAVRVAQAQLVHENHIEVVTETTPLDASSRFPSTDGLVTQMRDRALLVTVADCAAIALFDPKQQVIGMAHAGWKGTVRRLPQQMVEMMHTKYGCDPADILIGVSPSIGPCCYQVRTDLVSAFTAAFPQVAHHFFIPQSDDTFHLDMWTAIRWQLQAVGVLPDHIEMAEICTACHTSEFYSHRAEQGKAGRFASLIVLNS